MPTPRASAPRLSFALGSALVLGLWVLGVCIVLPQGRDRASVVAAEDLAHPGTPDAAARLPAADLDPGRSFARRAQAEDTTGLPPALSQALQRSSLRGSEIDGDLRLDAQGRLRLDAGLVRFFEYHLALLGELEPAAIRSLILQHATQRLGADAAADVLAAFDRYLGYRQARAHLSPTADLQDQLQAQQALEQQWFGEAAEAMFGSERDYDQRTLERLQSGTGDRSRALDADAPLADSEREARSALLAEEQSRQFEALGVSAQQRRSERTALWGAQAAARLDALDADRAAWEARLQAYVQERDRMLGGRMATRAELETLRMRRFDARERLRVEGLERAGAL